MALSFDDLRKANVARYPAYPTCADWTPSDWFTALGGEFGEAANAYKKVRRGDLTLEQGRTAIAKELADIQIYLDIVAEKLGIDLGEATRAKFCEVSARVGSDVML